MSNALSVPDAVTPTPAEAEIARTSSRQLVRFRSKSLKVRLQATGETVVLPASAVGLLVQVLSAMSEGSAVTIIPIHAELSTQEAADLLGVSRPFLVRQLDEGRIPFRKVGTHRRVLLTDLMRHKRETDRRRRKALDRLAADAQEHGMGY